MPRRFALIIALFVLAGVGIGLAAGLVVGRDGSAANRVTIGPAAASVSVPDLRGLSLSQAAQVLGSIGLKVGSLSARRNGWNPGAVLAQGVTPGSLQTKDRKVSLLVSAGPSSHVQLIDGQARVVVGGNCELIWPPPSPVCVGGPLLVRLVHG